MRILFSWTGVTSYMADCWRELQRADGVELKVVVEAADSGKEFAAERTFAGLDFALVERGGASAWLDGLLRGGWRPDVVFAGGWRSPTTRLVVAAFPDAPKVFCLDMPWRASLRCVAARFALWRFLRRFDAVFVPGAASAKYARWLGFGRDCIFTRLYAVDQARLRAARRDGPGRAGFLYVGRYSSEKRVDLIEAAYARYREIGGTWPLDCYGQGGKFAQADDMPGIYAAHACLLLASSFDPWPLVMLEAKAAGLEVVASDRCGNCDELGARKVPYGDVEAFAEAMLEVERSAGSAGRAPSPRQEPPGGGGDLAEYDCPAWARRVLGICGLLRRGRFFCPGMDDAANGMAVVARLLSGDDSLRGEYVVHGAWLPSVWLHCLAAMLRRPGAGYLRMSHGAYSPVYLEGCGKWKKRLVGPVERFFLRRAKRILATCDAEREWVERYLGPRRPPIEVVDLKRFFALGREASGRREPGEGRPLHLLYLGRRHPLKGVAILEEAVRGLGGVELRVVSDARGEEKERAWDWCDALVLPTLSENFGLVVAEALERGRRVVTTDGAPVWRGQPGVVFVEGFIGGTDGDRVRLLRGAIEELLDG